MVHFCAEKQLQALSAWGQSDVDETVAAPSRRPLAGVECQRLRCSRGERDRNREDSLSHYCGPHHHRKDAVEKDLALTRERDGRGPTWDVRRRAAHVLCGNKN